MKKDFFPPRSFIVVTLCLTAVVLAAFAYACSDMMNRYFRPAAVRSLHICFLVDQSASVAGIGWTGTVIALADFVSAGFPGPVSAGLQYLPVPPSGTIPTSCATDGTCGMYGPCLSNLCAGANSPDTSCDPADYVVPAVGLGRLDDVRQAIIDSLLAKTPNGSSTPTQPALTGVLSYASTWAQAHPDDQTIVIFITDGEPTNCSVNTITGAASAAGAAASGYPPVLTYVIALGTTNPQLTQIAAAGGTTGAHTVILTGDVRQQVFNYLIQIEADAAP